MWIRNDSEIIRLNGIGLFTKDVGDSPDEGEAPEDTIDDVNTNALKHNTRVTNSLCTNDCVGSDSWSLMSIQLHIAAYHFGYCPGMKVVQPLV